MTPTYDEIMGFYNGSDDSDKTDSGFAPRSYGRRAYTEWFLDRVVSYTTKAGVVKTGHTPVRIRGLYMLEKAINASNRAARRTSKAACSI